MTGLSELKEHHDLAEVIFPIYQKIADRLEEESHLMVQQALYAAEPSVLEPLPVLALWRFSAPRSSITHTKILSGTVLQEANNIHMVILSTLVRPLTLITQCYQQHSSQTLEIHLESSTYIQPGVFHLYLDCNPLEASRTLEVLLSKTVHTFWQTDEEKISIEWQSWPNMVNDDTWQPPLLRQLSIAPRTCQWLSVYIPEGLNQRGQFIWEDLPLHFSINPAAFCTNLVLTANINPRYSTVMQLHPQKERYALGLEPGYGCQRIKSVESLSTKKAFYTLLWQTLDQEQQPFIWPEALSEPVRWRVCLDVHQGAIIPSKKPWSWHDWQSSLLYYSPYQPMPKTKALHPRLNALWQLPQWKPDILQQLHTAWLDYGPTWAPSIPLIDLKQSSHIQKGMWVNQIELTLKEDLSQPNFPWFLWKKAWKILLEPLCPLGHTLTLSCSNQDTTYIPGF